MDAMIFVFVALAALLAYRLGHRYGIREGASRAQRALLHGATADLSEPEQTLVADEFRAIKTLQPSSSIRSIDDFLNRSFELGRIIAKANWAAGAAHRQRSDHQ